MRSKPYCRRTNLNASCFQKKILLVNTNLLFSNHFFCTDNKIIFDVGNDDNFSYIKLQFKKFNTKSVLL